VGCLRRRGGKTLHLSDLMQNQLIWASDRAAWRLQKLRRRAARAKVFNYRPVQWDGGARLPTRTRFDGVLVDAPCSGLGTWQRNPHARWTTTPDDVRELAVVQQQLLANVAPSVKPGGRLIYSVCTLTRGRADDIVRAFRETQTVFDDTARAAGRTQQRAAPTAQRVDDLAQDWGARMFVAPGGGKPSCSSGTDLGNHHGAVLPRLVRRGTDQQAVAESRISWECPDQRPRLGIDVGLRTKMSTLVGLSK
jgi:hypothetical protein